MPLLGAPLAEEVINKEFVLMNGPSKRALIWTASPYPQVDPAVPIENIWSPSMLGPME